MRRSQPSACTHLHSTASRLLQCDGLNRCQPSVHTQGAPQRLCYFSATGWIPAGLVGLDSQPAPAHRAEPHAVHRPLGAEVRVGERLLVEPKPLELVVSLPRPCVCSAAESKGSDKKITIVTTQRSRMHGRAARTQAAYCAQPLQHHVRLPGGAWPRRMRPPIMKLAVLRTDT